jgi:hypothetical protein
MGIVERWARTRPLPVDIQFRLKVLRPLLKANGVRLAYLFGSLARGANGHDLDLAVQGGFKPLSLLRLEMAEALGIERLDLIDLDRASPLLRFEVIRQGRLIYRLFSGAENDFEMNALKIYHDTQPLRDRQAAMLGKRTEGWLSGKP